MTPTREEMIQKIKDRIEYHSDPKKYGYFIGSDIMDYLAADILKDLQIADLTARAEKVELTMERLTRRGKKNKDWVLLNKICSKADGSFCPHAKKCNLVDNRTCPYLEVLDRLCEYEDTGLSPEEVWKLKASEKGE